MMDTPTKQIVLANYGKLKLARYLVRSYEDMVDVCQTVARQVINSVEGKQLFNLFNSIECRFTSVPNTLTSIIMGFMVPEKILTRQNFGSRPAREPEIRVPATQAPKYQSENGLTVFSSEIGCFFDLYLLHRFIRDAMNLSGEGMKLITSKRMSQLKVLKLKSGASKYKLSATFPCECEMENLIQLESQFLKQALTGR